MASAELSAIFQQMEVPVAVREDEKRGKHAVALKAMKGNTVLFEEIPIVSWPFAASARKPGSFCDWCLKSFVGGDSSSCSEVKCTASSGGCPAVYCSGECQARAANSHMFLCGAPLTAIRQYDAEIVQKSIASANSEADDEAVALPITVEALARSVASIAVRYAGIAQANPGTSPSQLFPLAAKLFDRLVSCPDSADFDEIDEAAWFGKIRSTMRPRILEILGAPSGEVCDALLSQDTLHTILGQLNLNAQALNLPVTVCAGDGDDDAAAVTKVIRPSVGAGLFALQSCLNHSCAPNAFVQFGNDHEISVKLRRGVTEGEEITITYIPELFLKLENYEARRSRLKSYFFKCACERCTAEEREAAAGSAAAAEEGKKMELSKTDADAAVAN